MTTEAVAIREPDAPMVIVKKGREQCQALMQIVKEAGLAKNLGGSKPHLEVEAWITILRFNGFVPKIMWSRPVMHGAEIVGYEARAEAQDINTGELYSGAEATCRFNEELEKADGTTFSRWSDDYACESMAQTRAVSKLGRVAFSWVAVLAGYSGTPAEEMEGVRRNGATRPVVFPFGRHKDQAPATLPVEDLHKELAFWEKKTADETNPKFKANNERLVAAIKEALAEKTATGERPPEPDPRDTEPPGESLKLKTFQHAETMKALLDKAWAKVDELCQAVNWNNKMLRDHCSATFPGTHHRKDLSADQVAHLVEYLQKLVAKREAEKVAKE